MKTLTTLLAVFVLTLTAGSAGAQYQDCPAMHQCLIGCAGSILSGASDDDFYACNDKCLNVEKCVEGRPGQTQIMRNARACAKLHTCLVGCADSTLSGANNDQLSSCNERCLNRASDCDEQLAATSNPGRQEKPRRTKQNNQQNTNNQQNNNQQPQADPVVAIVLRNLGVRSMLDLSGAVLCLMNDRSGQMVQRYFNNNGMEYTVWEVSRSNNLRQYESGRCDVTFVPQRDARSTLRSLRNPGAHMSLPEVIR